MNKNNSYTLSYPSPEPCSPSTTISSTYSAASTLTLESEHSSTKLNTKPVVPKKQYQCPLCHKNFSRPSALQTHSYTHTAEKPFQCLSPGCGRRFSVVSNLRRHFKIHQKPAVSNKISSEDRLRCVRQLIKTSNLMLAKQREFEHGSSVKTLSDGPFSYSTTTNDMNTSMKRRVGPAPSMNQHHELSSAYRYQHYILLPAIQPHYGSHIDPHHHQSNQNNNNYLLGSNNLCDVYLSNSRSSSTMDQNQQAANLIPQPSYSYNNNMIASYSTDTSSLSTPIVSPTHSYLDNN